MKQKNRKLLVAFGKGAAYILGWLMFAVVAILGAGLVLALWRSLLRIIGGSANCSPEKPLCAMLPTTFDYVAVIMGAVVVFLLAAAYFGFTRYYNAQTKRRDTWPWPQD